MNSVSQGGLALAEHIAAAYRDNPKVRVVLVSGSVARGCADEYSDLEMGIFWAEPPSEQARKAALARIGGELWAFDRDGSMMEHIGLKEVSRGAQHFSGTAMVSTNHMLVADMERCLSDVLDRYDIDLAKQNLLFAVQHAVPLYGEATVRRWQAQIAGYPEPLARRMVRENLWLGPWFAPHAYIGRDDRLVLYQHCSSCASTAVTSIQASASRPRQRCSSGSIRRRCPCPGRFGGATATIYKRLQHRNGAATPGCR